MGRFKKLGVSAVLATLVSTAFGVGLAAAAPVVFSPTPIAGWQTNGIVRAVLTVGDTVYVGGDFTSVTGGGQTYSRADLAAFDVHTHQIRTAFTADTNGVVYKLATNGSTLFVGGGFTTIKSVNRNRLASVDLTTGNVNTGFTVGATSYVYALAVSGNRLFVGGAFGTIGSQSRNRIAAVSTTSGAVDPTFNPNANNTVKAIVVSPDGSTVYAGGQFTGIGNTTRSYLVPLDSTTGAVLPIQYQSSGATVIDLDMNTSGTRLIAALGDHFNQAAVWDASSGVRQWFYQVDGDTQAVRYYNGNVYFGFHEGAIGDHTVRMLVADINTGALVPTYRLPIDSFYGIWDIDATPAGLILGGEFMNVNGVATQGMAILPPNPADPIPPTPPASVQVTNTTATTVSLSWPAGTSSVGVAGYLVLRDGVEVGEPTGTTFTDTGLTGNTSYAYTIETVSSSGTTSVPSPAVSANTDATIVAGGSVWKYLDDGSNQGTTWRAPGFNDASWAQGPARLGYGDGNEATVVSYGGNASNKYLTTYFRRQFNVANPAALGQVTLQLLRDDGAVVYLNGNEVVRSNMPTGTITSSSYASTDVSGTTTTFYPYSIAPSSFVAGTNTLAVEIHQNYHASADIAFDLVLGAKLSQGPVAPTSLHSTATTDTTASLAWTASPGSIDNYNVYRDGVLVGSPVGTTFTDSGLVSGQGYTYTVTAKAGTQESPPSTALVVQTVDNVPPSTPTGLAAPPIAADHVALTWNASTDNVAVMSYDIYRDGVIIDSSPTASYTDITVAPSHAYSYAVRAVDASHNPSGVSDPLAVSTPAPPPAAPTNLHTTAVGSTTVSIAWDAPGGTIANYNVYRDGTLVASPVGTTFDDSGLTSGHAYTYTVTAVDGASLESAPTAGLHVTTVDNIAPSKPTGLAATVVATDHVTLTWNASTDNVGVTNYDVYRNGIIIASPPGATYNDIGVAPGQTYTYAVRADDAASNPSDTSDPLTVSTPSFNGQLNQDTFDSGSFATAHWTTVAASLVAGGLPSTYFARLTASNAAANINWPTNVIQQNHRYWTYRSYFRVNSHNAGQSVNLVSVRETGGSSQAYMWADANTGRCTIGLGSAQATTSFSCTDGAWHLVEIRGDFGASTYTLDWKVDGVAQTSVSLNGQAVASTRSLLLGEGSGGHTNVQDWDNAQFVVGDAPEPFLGGQTPFG